jgi:hypothetical protein
MRAQVCVLAQIYNILDLVVSCRKVIFFVYFHSLTQFQNKKWPERVESSDFREEHEYGHVTEI